MKITKTKLEKFENKAFQPPRLKLEEKYLIEPFFTNLNRSIYSLLFLGPEISGALCSRASRTSNDLRVVFLEEFVKPFLKEKYGQKFKKLVKFLHQVKIKDIFFNPKAQSFYIKWLAQYGDDSIAQVSGAYIIFASLSQVAIKFLENQRIGISAIEKSTRYVDFAKKVNNHYLYFDPPELKGRIKEKYQKVMDDVFQTYSFLYLQLFENLKKKYPEASEHLLKTKTFDTIRTILPMATLGQVAFFGTCQALEYLINRTLDYPLFEIRWAGYRAWQELLKVIPSFLRRIEKQETKDYRLYLSQRQERLKQALTKIKWQKTKINFFDKVNLIEYDKEGEEKIISALIFQQTNENFEKILEKVKRLSLKKKEEILKSILFDRRFRWYKVPRAFENVYLRFEIITNIGAWRDLQRHRMQTQYHQPFSIDLGFEIPQEIYEFKLEKIFKQSVLSLENLYSMLLKNNQNLAQYSVSLAHRIRFLQYQNLREFFWESELRTISQGHPDYRQIEQQKALIVKKIYPLIGKYLLVDFNQYDFARREENSQVKEKEILNFLKKVKYHG